MGRAGTVAMATCRSTMTRKGGSPSQGKSGLSPRHVLRLRPKVPILASSPGHSRGRFVQAPPAICAQSRPAIKHSCSRQQANQTARKLPPLNTPATAADCPLRHARQHRSQGDGDGGRRGMRCVYTVTAAFGRKTGGLLCADVVRGKVTGRDGKAWCACA
mgnify:CR=1 FL=1